MISPFYNQLKTEKKRIIVTRSNATINFAINCQLIAIIFKTHYLPTNFNGNFYYGTSKMIEAVINVFLPWLRKNLYIARALQTFLRCGKLML